MEVIAPMIGSVAIMVVLGWMLKLGLDTRQRNKLMKYQYELQTKLLEKFNNTEELMEYLQGDAGQQFLVSFVFQV